MAYKYLLRWGRYPRHSELVGDLPYQRGTTVIIATQLGEELATVLDCQPYASRKEQNRAKSDDPPTQEQPSLVPAWTDLRIIRAATQHDFGLAQELCSREESKFSLWTQQIQEWQLALELLDVEFPLTGSGYRLYILSDRGPDSTRLALLAATLGELIEVVPVSREGIVLSPTTGGCGGGCSCKR